MRNDDFTSKLEHLVDGELGKAVLNGFYVVGYELFRELLDLPGGGDHIKAAMERAFADARRLRVPDSVPAEARDEWRHAAIEAASYFRDYMPEFDE